MLMFEPLRKYAQFSGRARRSEYWLFVLAAFIATVVGAVPLLVFDANGGGPAATALLVLYILLVLAISVPKLAVTFRRLHDIDKSAWWMLIVLIPAVGPVVLLVFLILDGTPGPNRYGQDPKNRPPAVATSD